MFLIKSLLFQRPNMRGRRRRVLLHGNRAGVHQSPPNPVPPRHGQTIPRGPRLSEAAGGQHAPEPADGPHPHPPISPQDPQAVAATPQPQNASIPTQNPGGEQEVPQGVRHGTPRAVVHPVQMEEGLLAVRRLIRGS